MKEKTALINLDSPDRFDVIRDILSKKSSLKSIYREVYQRYADCIKRCPPNHIALEVGSGAGLVKDMIPEMVTSDVLQYPNIDRLMDASHLKLSDNSVSCICLFNVLHHIPDTPSFFKEATRCLVPGGRVFMIEPYPGWLSYWIYRYVHHENFDMTVNQWTFQSSGPVSDANNALPYIIFERDLKYFHLQFPKLSLVTYKPMMPLRYWLTGGLKNWSLLPHWAYRFGQWIDNQLIKISPRFGSFVEIELLRNDTV